MITSKHFLLAVAFALLAGLDAVAMAQGKMDPRESSFRLGPEPITPVVKVNAIEVAIGKIGLDIQTKNETAFGYSFLGKTSGSLPGSLTLSINTTPATPVPGQESEITGGAWTLPVYEDGIEGTGYAGSLYGTITKGAMIWDKTGIRADVYILLNVDNGTQSWEGSNGEATFSGTLFVDEKTQKTMLTGDVVFTIFNAVAVQ